jgi:glucosamine kinase
MSFFLAVDAGGTKTDYALVDDTQVLARVRTGTTKRMRTDSSTALKNLDQAFTELAAASSISLDQITRTCIGAAGNTVPLVHDFYMDEFQARVSGEVIVVNDVDIALDAAFTGRAGVLVLAGTGSNVAGRSESGAVTTAGGWGPALADQGSGNRIGHEGLRAVFTAIDEGEPTILTDAILEFWHLRSIDELVDYGNRTPAPDFSALTRIVVHCSTAGDAVAKRCLEREGIELGRLAAIIIRRLKKTSADADWMPPVAFAGSICENVTAVRSVMIAKLEAEFPGIQTLPGVVDPIAGAIWRARFGSQPAI